MKPVSVVVVFTLLLVSGLLALVLFGHYFIDYLSSPAVLSVERPPSQTLSLGSEAMMTLHGSGFDRKTSVSLSMDVNSRGAIIGSLPLEGVYNDSLLSGDYLYLANSYGGLKVLDIKDPYQPRLFAEYLNGRTIVDIYRNKDHLYLSCGKSGLTIMAIQKDGTLLHVSDIAVKVRALNCQISAGKLLVAEGESGLSVYDLHDPKYATLERTLAPGAFVSKVLIAHGYLYLIVDEAKVDIYQLAKSGGPQLVGSLQLSGKIFDLSIQQKLLYVANGSGVSLYDLAVPSQPKFLQQWVELGSARKLFTGIEQIYVSDSFSGLRALVPGVDESSAYFSLNIDPRTFSETSHYLYIAGSNRGLLVVDKRKLSTQPLIPTINTSGSVHGLFIKQRWLYVADSRGGVLLKNLDETSHKATTISSRWGESFAAKDNLLFIAQDKMGIEILDISDPATPQPVAVWDHLPSMRLAILNNYLLSANGASGLNLVDISDLQNPVIVDVIAAVHVLDVAAQGNHVYVASKDEGLIIYQLMNSGQLQRVGQLQTPFPMNQFDYAVAVQVHGDIAYVANGRSGLLIIDVKKPDKPKILSSMALPGSCKDIHIIGSKIFVTSHRGGINVINVEHPKKPILMNNIPLSGLSRGVRVIDDIIYVGQRERGVAAVPVPVMAHKVKVVSEGQLQVTLSSPKIPGRFSLQVANQDKSVVVGGVVDYQ
ncbi:Uncharacterized conserved protein [Desulfuromusa kysingii]|uniref:Uncharacterized conserved protein n=1 Tax=Desulfuromusa kysingii TaxID=37625 RepID=A0A1H3YM07_9BACT|nr:hypothetical protein [Desulfuromusa kysingii]SEA12639.1 Uncharacterized conserved protein [Desulfuromusa kysingii]